MGAVLEQRVLLYDSKLHLFPRKIEIQVDGSFHNSPSASQWSGGNIQSHRQSNLQSQWPSSQAIHRALQYRQGGDQPP